MEIIEKELKTCPVGMVALYVEDEKVIQVPITFLYMDKNIYFFLDETSELYQAIHFNSMVSFAIIKNGTNEIVSKNKNISYQTFSITISGRIKKTEEQKIFDEVKFNYLKKYSGKTGHEIDTISTKALMIDTEEIQAVEETGG